MAKITRIMVAPLAVNCYIIATEQHNAVAIAIFAGQWFDIAENSADAWTL